MPRQNLRSFQDNQEFKNFPRSCQDIQDVERWVGSSGLIYQTIMDFLFSNNSLDFDANFISAAGHCLRATDCDNI